MECGKYIVVLKKAPVSMPVFQHIHVNLWNILHFVERVNQPRTIHFAGGLFGARIWAIILIPECSILPANETGNKYNGERKKWSFNRSVVAFFIPCFTLNYIKALLFKCISNPGNPTDILTLLNRRDIDYNNNYPGYWSKIFFNNISPRICCIT